MDACVLLGDVVGSRELTDRTRFGTRLRAACRAVTEEYAPSIVAPAKPLKGVDEVGVVFADRAATYGIAKALADGVRPADIRLAAAGGAIDVGTERGDVSAMDGPAFHSADELLDSVGRTGLRFDAGFDDPSLDRAIADEVNLLLQWRRDLTERHFEYVRAYERHDTQAAAAAALGVTQQSVSKVLRANGWSLVEAIEGRLQTTLEEYDAAG